MGKHVHRLSDKDIEARTAVCAHCGPVRLASGGKSGMRCMNAKREGSQTPRRVEYMKQYAAQRYAETGGLDQRRAWLKRYGLTVEQYDALVVAQNGCCAICKQPPGDGRLHVDHCHETGRVRGLLCRNHNTGLGLFEDDIAMLRAAIEYLET